MASMSKIEIIRGRNAEIRTFSGGTAKTSAFLGCSAALRACLQAAISSKFQVRNQIRKLWIYSGFTGEKADGLAHSKMKKRWVRKIIKIAAVMIALVAAIFCLLLTPPAQRFAFDRLRDYLKHNSGILLEAADVRLNVFGGSVYLDHLKARSAQAATLPPIFMADSIYARVSLQDALRGKWIVEELTLVHPEIHYFVGEQGQTNLPEFSSSSSGESPEFLIVHAEITQGAAWYQDLRENISARLPLWSLSINGDRETRVHRVNFENHQAAEIRYDGDVFPISKLNLNGDFDGSEIQLRSFTVATDGASVSVYGTIDISRPSMELNIRPTLDTRKIPRIASLVDPVEGKLSGEIRAAGDLDHIEASARIHIADFSIHDYRQSILELALQGEWRRDSGKLLLSRFDIHSDKDSLTGKAALSINGKSEPNTVGVQIRDLDLLPLVKLAGLPVDLAARAAGKIDMQWKGDFDPQRISADASLALTAYHGAPEQDRLPLSGELDAKLRANRLDVDARDLQVFGIGLAGQFSIQDFQTINGDFGGSAADIGGVIPQVARFLGKTDIPASIHDLTGAARFQIQASGDLDRPEISATLETRELAFGDLKNIDSISGFNLSGTRLAFKSDFTLPQPATAAFQGSLDFGEDDPVITLEARSEKIPLSAILRLADSDISADGDISVSLRAQGPLSDLKGNALIRGNNLSMYQESLGQLTAGLTLDNNEISSTEFRLRRDTDAEDFLEARFSYGIESGQFKLKASGKDLTLRRKLPENVPIPGKINFQISGEGTFDASQIDALLQTDELLITRDGEHVSLGAVSINAGLLKEDLTITAQVPEQKLSADIKGVLSAPYPFSGEVRAANSDLSILGLKLHDGSPLTGAFSAAIRYEGNLDAIEQTTFSANIQKLTLQGKAQEVKLFSPVEMEYRAGILNILNPIMLVNRSSQIELSGGLPLAETESDKTLKLRGRINLSEVASFAPLPEDLAVKGALALDLAISANRGMFEGKGEISVERAGVSSPELPLPFTDINARVEIRDGTLFIRQANAAWGGGNISLAGEIPFNALPISVAGIVAGDGPARFTLDVTGLTPEKTGFFPPELTGIISLQASGGADKLDIESLNAEVLFSELDFKVSTLDFHQQGQAKIEIHDGVASISQFSIIGPETDISLSGSSGLVSEEAPIDLHLNGFMDAALLTFADRDLNAYGRLDVRIAAGGTLANPIISGSVVTDDGRFSLRNPRIDASDLHIRLDLTPEKISVERFDGLLNGGSLSVEGDMSYRNGSIDDINLSANFQDVFLNAPEGLTSYSSGTLTVTSAEEAIVIGGNLRVMESSYREPLEVGGQVLSYLKSQQPVVLDEGISSLLNRIRYNVNIRTTTPLLVKNNVARVEANTSNLRLVGTFYEPSVTGRITLIEGGEITLNQRKYYLERGVITFVNQLRVEPELDIQAQTNVGGYEITLQIVGNPDNISTVLSSSDSSLSERDMLSLLLTGRKTSESQGNEMQVMQAQALSLLAGQAGEQLTGGARKALHLDVLRIDPGLITSESDPGARLTIGEDITRNLSLAYSMNLVNGGDQIWAGQYAITRRLITQATKQQDNSYRLEFRQDVRFGDTSRNANRNAGANSGASQRANRPVSTVKFNIGAIRFTGNNVFPENELQRRFGAKPGNRYDFSKIQKGLDRLHEFHIQEKYLESGISLKRETGEKTVNLELLITPGPAVSFSFEGSPVSKEIQKAVATAWIDGAFESERVEEAKNVIRLALIKDGYLQSTVTSKTETFDARKHIHFYVDRGIQYSNIAIVFSGAEQITGEQLRDALNAAALNLDVYANPRKVAEYLQGYYHEQGYLQAQVSAPDTQLNPESRSGQALINIKEGPLFTIGELEFTGNRVFTYDELWIAIPTSSGSSYDPGTLRAAAKAIESLYHNQGYNDVSVTFRVVRNTPKAQADLSFQIVEHRRSFIDEIVIEGNNRTNLNFVTLQLDFKKGEVLDFEKINESRRRLYATGVYSSVDFQMDEIAGDNSDENRKSMRIRLRLRENAPYRLQYGLFYDTERGMGGLMEAQNLNVLGRASNLGFRLRYDTELKEGRLYYNQPFVRMLHLKMDTSAFVQQEERAAYSARRIGFSLIQERALPKKYRLDYGYRYDHVRWQPEDVPLDPTIFQASVPVARLIATLTRDTRDSVLDATRGEFTTHTIEFGPKWLGSESGFARYYGQYFRYVPLDKYLGVATQDDKGKALPTRFVYAGALRVGLASSFRPGQPIAPERFFAGGGTTMRGFQQDLLGPKDASLRPTGGEAVFLFNSEIRFPIWSVLHGVGFVDIGNVYKQISDFDFSLRKTAGAGLRLKIKFIPLRFDYGFKLDRRPDEQGRTFFFSIGQAF